MIFNNSLQAVLIFQYRCLVFLDCFLIALDLTLVGKDRFLVFQNLFLVADYIAFGHFADESPYREVKTARPSGKRSVLDMTYMLSLVRSFVNSLFRLAPRMPMFCASVFCVRD